MAGLLHSYLVYRRENGEWVFWMNARSTTAARLRHWIWLKNRQKGISKEDIKVEPNGRT